MFFPNRITKISNNDTVLEIGPGGTPYHRADVFLERNYSNEEYAKHQRGNADSLSTHKPIFFYSGNEPFPFEDKSFDYVICSHVIEHVNNVPFFLEEMFRISHKGYIEFPKIQYEYLYNIYTHQNFIAWKNNTLLFTKKKDTHLYDFCAVQDFFYSTLISGYSDLIDSLKENFFDGFEWEERFKYQESSHIGEYIGEKDIVTPRGDSIGKIPKFFKNITTIFKKNADI